MPAIAKTAANDNIEPQSGSPGASKKRPSFRAADLKRAVKALQALGISAVRVEIEPDGKIVVISSATEAKSAEESLDRWMKQHARSA